MPAGGALHLPTCSLHGSDDLLGFLGAPALGGCPLLQCHAGPLIHPRASSMVPSWIAHHRLASASPHAAMHRDSVVPGHSGWIFALGPRGVRAATVLPGQRRSPTVTDG